MTRASAVALAQAAPVCRFCRRVHGQLEERGRAGRTGPSRVVAIEVGWCVTGRMWLCDLCWRAAAWGSRWDL